MSLSTEEAYLPESTLDGQYVPPKYQTRTKYKVTKSLEAINSSHAPI